LLEAQSIERAIDLLLGKTVNFSNPVLQSTALPPLCLRYFTEIVMRVIGMGRSLLLGLSLLSSLAACAQDRKPGLYELTITTTTIQPAQSVFPPRTHPACLTQEMIDKYGAIVPESLTRTCQLVNVVKKPGGMTADMVCNGGITGKGTLEVTWTDSEHSRGTLHFSGEMRLGQPPIKIEWNAVTTSAYKGPDCGDTRPTKPPTPPATP
jgi:hypothetical protein